MDKKLLDALNNLSDGLQEIAEALKDRKGSKTATGQALSSQGFSKDLVSIAAGIKSIKQDTQEILKQQKTILSMSKRESRKDTDVFEKAGDKKSESGIKKGVGTILLIAVAVLAIGAAFKLVGNVNFLSVIAISLAMIMLAEAFARIAVHVKTMTLKDVARVSFAMIAIATAVMVSSYILANVQPVGIMQLFTALIIGFMFAQLAPRIGNLLDAVSRTKKINPIRLLLTMVAISLGITASSYILKGIVPIGIAQAITGILIAAMFAVISKNIDKMVKGLGGRRLGLLGPLKLVLGMVGVAMGITASSVILSNIRPVGFFKMLTAIMIAAMFAVVSFNLDKLAKGVSILAMRGVSPFKLVLTMVGISTAIMASSHILSNVKPITFTQFLVSLGIALMFGIISFFMPSLATGIVTMDKALGAKKMLVVLPLVFIAISIAIMLSSHILSMSKQMTYKQIFNLAVFGVVLAILVLAFMPAVLAVGFAVASGVGAMAILGGAAMIPVIATAIMISSHILSAGNYTGPYPGFRWALGVGVAMTGFAAAMLALGLIAITGVGAAAILAGFALIPLVAQSIVDTSNVIRKGKYDKYPGPGWALTVTPLMIAFGAMVVALGVVGLFGPVMKKGLKAVPDVAQSIVDTARIIGEGNYDKYPGPGWALTVTPLMLAFATMVVALGVVGIFGPVMKKGLKAIPDVAQSIVDTARIIGQGKYDKYPGPGWALTVTPLMLAFATMIVALGVLVVGTLGLGGIAIQKGLEAIKWVAQSIVSTSKIIARGKYDKYPGAEWALSVGGLMLAFGTAVVSLGILVVGTFGLGGKALAAGVRAVKLIARSIVSVGWIFSNSISAFKAAPKKEWAEGVGLAIGAFAPVYKMLLLGGVVEAIFGTKVTPGQFASAIRTISRGIVDAAKFFGSKEANVAFEGGPKKEWSEGVGKAIAAFAPVYKMLVKGGIMEYFVGKGPSIWGYVNAIKAISKGIVASAKIFAENKTTFESGYPSEKWGKGVGAALKAFKPVLEGMAESSLFESDTEQLNQMVHGIKKISYAIVKVGYIFSGAKNIDWNAFPNSKWGESIKKVTSSFLDVAETVADSSSSSRGWEVVSVAKSLSAVAQVFTRNKKFFGTKIDANGFVKNVKGGLSAYLRMAYMVKKNVNAYWKNIGKGKDFMVSVAKSFVDFSKAIARGRGSFDTAMDPNFMRSIHGNVRYFMRIVDMLKSQGGIGDKINQALFDQNPMKPLADGMIMLADSFDRIAVSLGKFSTIISTLDDKKLQSVVGFGQKVMAGQPKGFLSSLSSAAGGVVESAGGLVSGLLNKVTPTVKSGGPMKSVQRGRHGTQMEQMDKLIDTMRAIMADTKVFKDFISRKMAELEDASLGGLGKK